MKGNKICKKQGLKYALHSLAFVLLVICFILSGVVSPSAAFALDKGCITTFAGASGAASYSGDGGKAIEALIGYSISGLAYDSQGNIYFADTYNNRIRMVAAATSSPFVTNADGSHTTTPGYIYTIAGTGTAGDRTEANSGDGGPAASANLNGPCGVAVDSNNNIYISDTGNNVIRMIAGINSTTGTTSSPFVTYANGTSIVPVAGNIYRISGTYGSSVFYGNNVAAIGAKICTPKGIAIDSTGDIIFADNSFNRIRMIAAASTPPDQTKLGVSMTAGYIYVISGGGNASSTSPSAGSIDSSTNNLLGKISAPQGIAVDKDDNIYFTDTNRVRMIAATPNSTFKTSATVGYTYTLVSSGIPKPQGVALDGNGNIYIADTSNNRIRMYSTDKVLSTIAGSGATNFSGDNGPATGAGLYAPTSVLYDPSGNLYICGPLDINKSNGVIRYVQMVTPPPVMSGAETSSDGTKLVLTFDKAMDPNTLAAACFSVKVDGNADSVTSVTPDADYATKIELTLDTPAASTQTVLVSYTPGTVGSSDSGLLAKFTDISVTNKAGWGTVATPTATPTAGEVEQGTEISFTSTVGALLYYTCTTDGSLPPAPTTSSTQYIDPIAINSDMTIRAIAVKDGMIDSGILTAAYTAKGKVATPTAVTDTGAAINPDAVPKNTKIKLSTTTDGASIWYTTNGEDITKVDGAFVNAAFVNAALYSDSTPIIVDRTMTIKAIAVKEGTTDSDQFSIVCTLAPQVAKPTGEYMAADAVIKLSATTKDALIYYTIDRSTPTATSTLYENPIPINSGMYIRAIAVKDGMSDSDVFSNNFVKPSDGWSALGSPGFSTGEVRYTSMFVENGTQYVAYQDMVNGGKVTVKKLNGSSWDTVGTEGFSAGEAQYVSLCVYNGTPYVAYQDGYNDGKVTVAKAVYGADGTYSWETIGTEGFSSGTAYYTSISVANDGTLYVAYRDSSLDRQAVVKKYDGSNWVSIGGEGFSPGAVYGMSLYIDGSTPYVIYKDGTNGNKAVVKKYNAVSDSWVTVGAEGFSDGDAGSPSLFVKDGTPYAAYQDYTNACKATVKKFDGSSWVTLGTEGFSAGEIYYPSLYMDNGILCLAYIDSSWSFSAVVKMYNERQSSWEYVKTAEGKNYLSVGQALYVSQKAEDGTLYVAYQDGTNGKKATVMKYCRPLTVAVPETDKVPGYIAAGDSVSLTSTSGADIYYTTDGNAPTTSSTPYSGPIQVNSDTTIKAYAVKGGMDDSAILTASYTTKQQVVAPSTDTLSGEVDAGKVVKLSSVTDAVYFYYTTNGDDPTTDSTSYDPVSGIVISQDITLKAIAIKAGMRDSEIFTAYYTVKPVGDVATPKASINSGAVVQYQAVTLTTETDGASIYYTTDGSEPTTASILYKSPIKIYTGMTIKAIAVKSGMNNSPTLNVSYTITGGETLKWAPVGQSEFSADKATTAKGALKIYNGIPYVAYSDAANGGKATVMKYTETGWETVGVPGFSAGVANYISLYIDETGTPYVAYQDQTFKDLSSPMNNRYGLSVQKYNEDSNSWDYLGYRGLGVMTPYNISLVVDSGIPYVGYVYNNNSNVGVKEYHADTGSWSDLGLLSDTNTYQDCKNPGTVSLYVKNGMPYIVYTGAPTSQDERKATVRKYDTDTDSNSWIALGTTQFTSAIDVSLVIDNDANHTPYVAYSDYSSKVTVMKYENEQWTTVGTKGFSDGWTNISLDIDNDENHTPYVAYNDGSGNVTVMKYGGDWVSIGTSQFVKANGLSFAVENGTPYVAFSDSDSASKETVMKYGAAAPSSSVKLSDLKVSSGSLAFDPDTTNYSVTVGNDISSVTVTPTASATAAGAPYKITVTANGQAQTVTSGTSSQAIELTNIGPESSNEIKIEVTDTDESSNTYTIYVTRLAQGTEQDFTNNGFSFNGVKINGVSRKNATVNGTGGYFGTDSIDDNVPVDATFTLTSTYKLLPLAPSYDPDTKMLSTTVLNKALVVIRKTDGATVPVNVSNNNTANSGNDAYINVQPTQNLSYNTQYQLVVKKYFTKVNDKGEITGGVTVDVVIPFKTVADTSITEAPDIVSVNPADGAVNVPVGQDITVQFSQSVTQSVYFNDILVTTNGGLSVVGCELGLSDDGYTLTLDPQGDLEHSVTYAVYIPAGAVKNAEGIDLQNPYNFTFTTAAVTSVPVTITGVKLNKVTMTLTAGGATGTLTATVTPANATNKAVTWSTSNSNVATVDQNGVVTPVAKGTAIITVTTTDGSFKANCTVTVSGTTVTIPATGVTLDRDTMTLTAGGATGTLTATVSPSNATNKAVTWSTSNSNVARVTNGVVTPVSAGTATITVTTADGSFKATSTVTVNAATTHDGGGNSSTPSGQTTTDLGQVSQSGNTATLQVDAQKAAAMLNDAQQSKLVIDLSQVTTGSATEKAVQLPAEVVDLAKTENKPIAIQDSGLTMLIPPQVLTQGQEMTFSTTQVSSQTVTTAPEQVENKVVYSFDASSGGTAIHNFQQAITITLPIPAGVTDPEKLGVYYLNETTGQWEYMGGRIVGDKIVFTTNHFSKYMVAESIETFPDIASHWAKSDIEVMVARHIVNGVDSSTFAPQSNITRAEFAALLSRVLKLTDAAGNTFKDVTGSEWYAGDVGKAAKAGIILGSDGSFRPGDRITRQEMAVMIQRAYSYAGGKAETLKDLTFTDKDSVSAWANDAVQNVYSLGIIKGRTDGSFGAVDNATRAEGTVMLKTLMDKLGL